MSRKNHPREPKGTASARSLKEVHDKTMTGILELCAAAEGGDRNALGSLLIVTKWAAELVDGILERDPKLVKDVVHALPRRHGLAEDFPTICSWRKKDNRRRALAIAQLKLGESLPFKADGGRDEFYYRVVGTYVPMLKLQKGFGTAPTTKKECRRWAKGIADMIYPRKSPRTIHPIDMEPVGKATIENSVRKWWKETEAHNASAGTEPETWMKTWMKEDRMEKRQYAIFRTRFIDATSSRLLTIYLKKPAILRS